MFDSDTKRKIAALRERIENLENRPKPKDSFVVYEPFDDLGIGFFPRPSSSISYEDAIRMLADHVGMRFEYKNGSPDAVVLVPKPQSPQVEKAKKGK